MPAPMNEQVSPRIGYENPVLDSCSVAAYPLLRLTDPTTP
ncbi:hypothetical protein BJ970_001160 [Saccharopolyspora phatthalungensis]|uniref:Uncharacterized protein n=1 Tax=Saccharopolyspora phatthalungensis TaxID=664693 RepID=A0A840PZB0_9PSEU|nr:hypothetical protein [Saccharopolyspora phatthalungensis]